MKRRIARVTMTVLGALVVVIIVASAAGVRMGHTDGFFRHVPVAELRRHMDTAPVPPGAVLVREEADEGSGDRASTLTREYRTTLGTPACAQVIAAAHEAGWEFIDMGKPIDARTCATQETPSGDLMSRATDAVPITVTWDGARLYYILGEGDY